MVHDTCRPIHNWIIWLSRQCSWSKLERTTHTPVQITLHSRKLALDPKATLLSNTCNTPPFNWHLEVKQTSVPLYSVSSIRVSLCVRVWGCETTLYNPVNECSSSLPTVAHWNQRAEQTDRLTLCVCSDYLSAHESVLQVTEGECVYKCVCKVCLCIYKRLAFACVSITGGCVGMISHWVLIYLKCVWRLFFVQGWCYM